MRNVMMVDNGGLDVFWRLWNENSASLKTVDFWGRTQPMAESECLGGET